MYTMRFGKPWKGVTVAAMANTEKSTCIPNACMIRTVYIMSLCNSECRKVNEKKENKRARKNNQC